ncbi:phosphatase PAP2 family protein [Streptomyces sp. NBC_00487]|uniref:phosphatase PAP2 family protein n=1 Tax=unclassified Streptomyces TaxID=2593676 RepID=UPI002E19CB9D|nr:MULTISPECIES: phosphatase PAP2 family protein [unclassified Streptomyces]
MDEVDVVGGVRGLDRRLLSALHVHGADPRVAGAARGLSRVGEHGLLWLAAGLAGAAVDRRRRRVWLRGTALTAGAHLASMGVKRVVRRPRPAHVHPLVRTVGRHSFPSSHASSAAAAVAVVAHGALGAPLLLPAAAPLAVAMCLSRLVVGVHYPSDVAAGVALGALTARLGARWVVSGDG